MKRTMKKEDFSIKDKIDILKHAEVMQRNELATRRDEETKVFTWSSTILLAIIGALLVANQSENIVWAPYGVFGKTMASIAIAALVFFSVIWQNRHHHYHVEGARVIVRIERLLHYFEKGFFDANEALFPEKWETWGKQKTRFVQIFRADRSGATLLLGGLAIVVIWLA
jgi:hypothetical protein